ncbi:MAG: hypothetical protein R2712_14290 [Vicinamibacterales bacterium]
MATYVAAGLLVVAWAAPTPGISVERQPPSSARSVSSGGALDVVENRQLARALSAAPGAELKTVFAVARVAAMSKFAVLLFGLGGALAAAGGGLRLLITRLRRLEPARNAAAAQRVHGARRQLRAPHAARDARHLQ